VLGSRLARAQRYLDLMQAVVALLEVPAADFVQTAREQLGGEILLC
jgi:hypothetical protein